MATPARIESRALARLNILFDKVTWNTADIESVAAIAEVLKALRRPQ